MYHVNIPALLLILALNKFLLGILIYYLKFQLPSLKGLNFWALGSILTAIGLAVYSATPYPSSPLISFSYTVSLNALVYFGDSLFLAGFWVFFGKRINKTVFIIPILAILTVIIFTFIHNIVWIRHSICASLGFVLYIYSAIEISKISKTEKLKHLLVWCSFIYFFYGFLQLTRALLSVIYKPINPNSESLVSVMLFSLAGISIILLTFNLIIIITSTISYKLKEEIKHKNKLHAIISHDLRSPIGNFMNYSNLLKKSVAMNDKIKTDLYLKNLEQISYSSRFLLENLLCWSQSQINQLIPNFKKTDLIPIVQSNLKIIEPFIFEKNITINFLNTEAVFGYFDENMISIVFRNLIANAMKFTKKNGEISVSIQEKMNKIELKVIDNGIGIIQEQKILIFSEENISSTKGTSNEKGSGFGLLLCKQFMELNNGSINVESEAEKGSTFTIILPKSNLK